MRENTSTVNPAGFSPVGFGAWEAGGGGTWGPNTSTTDVVRAVHAACDAGVNWIDTAEVYGGGGGSEIVVGAALRGHPEIKVCTKVAPEDETHFSPAGMRAALTASLGRLGRSHVDAYLLHWPSPSTPVDAAWEALVALKAEGLAATVGLSNFPLDDVTACARTGDLDYLQIQASVLYREELHTYGPLCAEYDVGVMTYGALSYGLLTGAVRADSAFTDWRGGVIGNDDFFCVENHARFFAADVRPGHLATAADLRDLAAELDLSPARLALAWLLAQRDVTTTLAGTRDVGHARDNALAATTVLSPGVRARIDAMMPGVRA
ncbi:aldo/keto reductase [Actinoplanes sp. NPDC051494]|uniref:aldo/keto reductase n=1 Tax=Actinoplanes sp. NPDC051494 TaxID=3363907 RepID=UPI0037875D05